jgi:isocitrate dehydrogenase
MTEVTLIAGDGIGPEITDATVRVLKAAGADLTFDSQVAGERGGGPGSRDGVPAETFASIERTRVALKAPLGTPLGGGARSSNVALRKHFDLYANVRPAREIPGIVTPFSGRGVDLIVVREGTEDTYIQSENRLTASTAQALKVMTEPGCERIVRAAFEVAVAERRPTMHCATKANILKLTEGMLKRVFEQVAQEYPQIEARHLIVDNAAHQLVVRPEQFDVIVMSNMNGDILSDLTAGLVGGLGIAASANLGQDAAMFEAVHGTAPDIAGQGKANPTAMLGAAVMMLRHLNMMREAALIEVAVEAALLDGRARTGDLGGRATTSQFTDAIIRQLERIETDPLLTRSVNSRMSRRQLTLPPAPTPAASAPGAGREPVGVDVFFAAPADQTPEQVALALRDADWVRLDCLVDRGNVIWTEHEQLTPRDLSDCWCARLLLDRPAGRRFLIDDAVFFASERVNVVQTQLLHAADDTAQYTRYTDTDIPQR